MFSEKTPVQSLFPNPQQSTGQRRSVDDNCPISDWGKISSEFIFLCHSLLSPPLFTGNQRVFPPLRGNHTDGRTTHTHTLTQSCWQNRYVWDYRLLVTDVLSVNTLVHISVCVCYMWHTRTQTQSWWRLLCLSLIHTLLHQNICVQRVKQLFWLHSWENWWLFSLFYPEAVV